MNGETKSKILLVLAIGLVAIACGTIVSAFVHLDLPHEDILEELENDTILSINDSNSSANNTTTPTTTTTQKKTTSSSSYKSNYYNSGNNNYSSSNNGSSSSSQSGSTPDNSEKQEGHIGSEISNSNNKYITQNIND